VSPAHQKNNSGTSAPTGTEAVQYRYKTNKSSFVRLRDKKIQTLQKKRPQTRSDALGLSAFAMVAVFAVAARAILLDLRRIAVLAIGRGEIKIHQFGAIQLLISAPEYTAQHTGESRNDFHAIVLSAENCHTSSRFFNVHRDEPMVAFAGT
jgi:hypothetical protein